MNVAEFDTNLPLLLALPLNISPLQHLCFSDILRKYWKWPQKLRLCGGDIVLSSSRLFCTSFVCLTSSPPPLLLRVHWFSNTFKYVCFTVISLAPVHIPSLIGSRILSEYFQAFIAKKLVLSRHLLLEFSLSSFHGCQMTLFQTPAPSHLLSHILLYFFPAFRTLIRT